MTSPNQDNNWPIHFFDTDAPSTMAPDNLYEDDDGRMLSKGMSK